MKLKKMTNKTLFCQLAIIILAIFHAYIKSPLPMALIGLFIALISNALLIIYFFYRDFPSKLLEVSMISLVSMYAGLSLLFSFIGDNIWN